MSSEQNQDVHKVGVTIEDRIVRVVSDDALSAKLSCDPRGGSYRLADQISADYAEKYGSCMPFSVRSLACEIYWHYQVKLKSEAFERRFGKRKFTTWLLRHMEVIDCGDQKADSNRFVWNLLSIFFPRRKRSGSAADS